jgi:hypothetical protein
MDIEPIFEIPGQIQPRRRAVVDHDYLLRQPRLAS